MKLNIVNLGKVSVTIDKDYWDISKDYDTLVVVQVKSIIEEINGKQVERGFKTFISRKPVPAGTVITNRDYWIPFSSLREDIVLDYNTFVAKYGTELNSVKEHLTEIDTQIDVLNELNRNTNKVLADANTAITTANAAIVDANETLDKAKEIISSNEHLQISVTELQNKDKEIIAANEQLQLQVDKNSSDIENITALNNSIKEDVDGLKITVGNKDELIKSATFTNEGYYSELYLTLKNENGDQIVKIKVPRANANADGVQTKGHFTFIQKLVTYGIDIDTGIHIHPDRIYVDGLGIKDIDEYIELGDVVNDVDTNVVRLGRNTRIGENVEIDGNIAIGNTSGGLIIYRDNTDGGGVQLHLDFSKQLSTEDFTTALKKKLESLSNYDDSEIRTTLTQLVTNFNTLLESNPNDAINSFNEIIKFLENIEDTESLSSIIAGIQQTIADSKKEEANERKLADDELKELIVKLHAVITFSVNNTTLYRGETETVNFTHSVKFDGNSLTYNLTVDGTPIANWPGTIKVDDAKKIVYGVFTINNANPKINTTVTKSITFNAAYPRYYFVSEKTSPTETDIVTSSNLMPRALNATATNVTRNVTTSAKYLWLCVPDGMTINKVVSNGFDVPMESPTTVAITNKGNYNCYRSTNKINVGSITFNVQ